MSAQQLVERLEKVRQTGQGRWVACCPAHDDRKPSLTVREMDDGMVLVKCWAGCSFSDVVSAAGLAPADLFPAKPLNPGEHGRRGQRRPFPATDILAAASHEALYVALAARDLAGGLVLSADAIRRLFVAAGRLLAAAEAGGGGA